MAIVTKTYSSKTNTIYKDSCTNLGLNPIMCLDYGRNVSRGMIYFDHNKVKELVFNDTMPDMKKMKHL